MIAFVPVSRYKVDYQVAAGRPYSLFERLLMEAIVSSRSSLDNLQRTFRVHRRVVIEGLVTLMQAGWVALDEEGFVPTALGTQVVERPGELPKNIVLSDRSDFLIGERVHGQLARRRDVTYTRKSDLQQHWNDGVAIPKNAIPHPLEPGLVVPFLRRESGEWIRACDTINIVRDSADFVVADVDTARGLITGIPASWVGMLREDLLEHARRKERELTLSGRAPEDRTLKKFVRRKSTSDEGASFDPDEWSVTLTSEAIVSGSDEHATLLENGLASARQYVAIVSSGVDGRAIGRLEGPLRAAIDRGILIDIAWGASPEGGDRASHQAGVDLLKKIERESHQAAGRGRLTVGKQPSGSHAKILLSDAGGEFEAIIGSYDWLAGDSGSPRIHISLKLDEPGPVGQLCRVVADLAMTDGSLSKGPGIARLRNAAANLDRRSVEVADAQKSGQADGGMSVRARLVVGRRHHAVLGALAKTAKKQLIIGTHRWGLYAKVGFRELECALENGCPRVEMHYGVRDDTHRDESSGADFEKRGGIIHHANELHAKFAVCDDDIAVITSFNWLSPDLDHTQPSASDVGFVLRGKEIGSLVLDRLGLAGRPATVPPARTILGTYVVRATVTNLRSIGRFVWEVPPARAPGWHVLVGDNGSGKSTVLRALALALVGAREVAALRQDWGAWVREAQAIAEIEVVVDHQVSLERGMGLLPGTFKVTWTRTEDRILPAEHDTEPSIRQAPGFFTAAYGPFRRFTGGDPEFEKQLSVFPALARHLSMFDERVALTEGLAWLKELRFRELESDQGAALLLRSVTEVINDSKLLPNDVKIVDVSHAAVVFADSEGHHFSIEELSDGYRSILSLTLDLLRQLSIAFGPTNVFDPSKPGVVAAPGVVLIDEVDAHLHPSWQRTVGQWFCDHFPRVQFIVASHSPLVCQAAERGTVYRLPSPGDEGDRGGMLEGHALDRLVYGNVLEAYASGAFGQEVSRSDSAQQKLERLAELNTLELERALSPDEMDEQNRLRATFPTSAHAGVNTER